MSQAITVVSGLPRSGTSLMLQMLEAGGLPALCDGTRAPDEDNPRGYYELERVKALARDASCVSEARGRALKVIVPLLAQLPPGEDYRVILMQRSLSEVVASQDRMLARRGAAGSKLEREPLLRIFALQLEDTRAQLSRCGIPSLEVPYPDAVRDAAETARKVAAFLSLSLDVAAMARAVDASLHRERDPHAQR